ncbi:hypothetical protein ACL9RG_08555 [Rouxiella sp. Mn2063]
MRGFLRSGQQWEKHGLNAASWQVMLYQHVAIIHVFLPANCGALYAQQF